MSKLNLGIVETGIADDATGAKREWLTDVFCFAFLWTSEQFAHFFHDTANPVRAATACLGGLENQGLINSQVIDTNRPEKLTGPLHVHRRGYDRPDFHRIAYVAEKRRSQPAKPTRVYWPTSQYAVPFGAWAGRNELNGAHKAGHDLLVTECWIYHLQHNRTVATRDWVSEREMEHGFRRGRQPPCLGRRLPRPDALIWGNDRITAIEVAGFYPAAWLETHATRFENAGWDYEIW